MTWDHRYRMLHEGEIIKDSDECLTDAALGWHRDDGRCAGQPAPSPCYSSHRMYRRWCYLLDPNDGVAPTTDEFIDAISELIFAAHDMCDNGEDDGDPDTIMVTRHGFDRVSQALDVFDGWPHEPGTICGSAAKAKWALLTMLKKHER